MPLTVVKPCPKCGGVLASQNTLSPDQCPRIQNRAVDHRPVPYCAGRCSVCLFNRNGDRNQKNVVTVGEAFYHENCSPSRTQSWQQLIGVGIRAIADGVREGIRRHPYITTAALTAVAGVIAYTYASAETFQTHCFRDLKERDVSWCASMPASADPTSVPYEKFIAVKNWVPSGSFISRSFEEIKDGAQFVYGTCTKFFVNNVFKRFFG